MSDEDDEPTRILKPEDLRRLMWVDKFMAAADAAAEAAAEVAAQNQAAEEHGDEVIE